MTRQKDRHNKPTQNDSTFWWKSDGQASCHAKPPKPGDVCPECGEGLLAYDGLFVLTCEKCGKAAEAGAFT